MTLKEQCALITDVAFAAGVLRGIEKQQAHPNATVGVEDARERLEQALAAIMKLPVSGI